MPLRSHVDPCVFVVFLDVRLADTQIELRDALRAIENRHGADVSDVLARLEPRAKQVLFHERYHYWQGLRLPFLFWYGALVPWKRISLKNHPHCDQKGYANHWTPQESLGPDR
jgi:hypothetical protein